MNSSLQPDQSESSADAASDSSKLFNSNLFSSSLLQEHKEKLSELLYNRRFMHIPPPSGFGSFTRPSTLLETLVRGPVSLDKSSLSPTTQKRLAYIHHNEAPIEMKADITHSEESANGIREENVKEDKCSFLGKQDFWADLPLSPVSPPSPFQHPFFQQQLGFFHQEPSWARFSWFGHPHLNPIHREPFSTDFPSQSEGKDIPSKDNKKKRNSWKNKYHTSTTKTVVCYCQNSNSYKISKETRFSPTLTDDASETESDDEDDAYTDVSKSKLRGLNKQHIIGVHTETSSSGSEDVLPISSSSTSISKSSLSPSSSKFQINTIPHSHIADYDTISKHNSQSVAIEAGVDVRSVTPCKSMSHDPSVQFSQSSQDSCGEPDSSLTCQNCDKECPSESSNGVDKVHKIALEILHSERSYVNVLYIIDQEFQFRVDQQNRVHNLFPSDQIPLMFANIKSIYKLHHDFLLPQLEERMSQWDQCKKIGDIMKNFAPFLKMYTEYVKNFDSAMMLISAWQTKSPKFAAIMDEIQNLKSCGNLTIQHHMLSPVQRIPRYEMLLKNYLRKLPDDDPDRKDTEEALHLVSTAANHANDAMKKIDKFKKLLEIQESLGGGIELVSPTRELLKEGRIIKISARSGDHQERYLFLFSDLLLLCTSRLIGGRVMSGPQYRLRARYKVENLEVLEGDNLETENSFYIRDTNKTVELYTQTKEQKESWLNMLFLAISDSYQRKASLRLNSQSDTKAPDPDLGLKQPILIRTDSVTKCMLCASHFSVVRRKHHCKACGSVVCNKCSNHKINLPCESGKNVRVCQTCHDILLQIGSQVVTTSLQTEEQASDGSSSRPESGDSSTQFNGLVFKSRGILDVSANAPEAVISGYLQLKTHRKAWIKRWFSLHPDFVLYSFKSDEEEQALTAMPLPGFTVSFIQNTKGETGISEKEKDKLFKIYHAKKQYIFLSSVKDEAVRWVAALQKASHAELPSPVQ